MEIIKKGKKNINKNNGVIIYILKYFLVNVLYLLILVSLFIYLKCI